MAIVSDLPPDVLDLILARLPLRNAARSSVLSVAWGQSWRHLSDLDFTSSTCDRAAIDAVLLGHSGSVRHARLKVTDGLLPGVPAWVDALSEKMLQSFNLNFNAPSVPSVLMEGQVPKSMFACGALKDLVLTRGVLSAVPVSLTGFPSLTNLCLTCSSFEKGSDLEAMPQKLEVLQMRAIRIAAHGWHELRMESSSLRFLEIQGHGNIKWVATRLPRVAHVNFNHAHRDSAANILRGMGPSVEKLEYNYYSLGLPSSYKNLRRLRVRMNFNNAPDISSTIYFLSSAPNLTQLVVQDVTVESVEESPYRWAVGSSEMPQPSVSAHKYHSTSQRAGFHAFGLIQSKSASNNRGGY